MPKELVLVGGGHAHVHVLKAFGERPEPGVHVTLVTRDLLTPYSGMLPGLVAGLYGHAEAHIDLTRLARATGTRLVHAEATDLDLSTHRVICRDHAPLPFDTLSLDIGSAPRLDDVPGALGHTLPVKPVEPFLRGWAAIVDAAEGTDRAPRLAIVGGGVGGVEVALAMSARLSRALQAGESPAAAPITLVTREALLPRLNGRARRLLARALATRGVTVLTGAEVARVEPGALVCNDGRRVPFDHAVWVTWAGAAAWLRRTGLALDEKGFVTVDAALQSVSHPGVFAAGDVAAVLPHPREKAGVYAVRQGPPLADNLRRSLRGESPQSFTPQRRALALVGTGDRRAVGAWGPLATEGAWVWRAKTWVDRRWMERYRDAGSGRTRDET